MGSGQGSVSPAAGGDVAALVVVARQPIFDRDEAIVGFEVLYRPMSAPPVLVNPAAATSRVIVHAVADIGLDHLTGDRPAHINVTREFLLEVRPLPLSPERVVLELVQDQIVDAALIEVLGELVEAGFAIALDDFQLGSRADRLLELASIVKLDIRALDGPALINHVARLRERVPTLIAEKVETREEYAVCRALGFDAFQGYFFAQPVLVAGRSAPTRRLHALAALAGPAPRASFEQLERLIVQDAGLSHKLVRLANSAFVGARHEVASVHRALTLLGTVAVRRWAMVLVLSGLTDRPHHLLGLALQRARLCELLAARTPDAEPDRAFTAGLFSILDGLLGTPMRELVDELPFDERMTRALLHQQGPEGRLLGGVLAHERGDFTACHEQGLDLPVIADAYRHALDWTRQATAELR
jgi:EAL and modified HD-GYP domain-containing signal transduction protein